ncbi:FtsL-like putative cell division protein [Myroides pelagicus]|uniref:S-adenosyl-methyltransferase n=1 Tax=Myroides pelagicus TaxID=270914 RepID=A0A7K1GQJ2_9FLAO|nr:FtsL-like putative cell division protein [Myroides pelagicus]MEC4114525.1 FtsL-like putative cell division protein [Myroides pelagicus]MTH30799.1 S-adenosyl-methyltransferase [Myroides pelagicus]
MKKPVISPMDIIKAKLLVHEGSARNWAIIIYVIIWCIVLIRNTQAYEEKVFKMNSLTHDVKMLRAEFVDTRSELMELKMESTITKRLEEEGIHPSENPPTKIKLIEEGKSESFWSKLWR